MKSNALMQIRIPTETKQAAQQRAAELGISLSSYIKLLINSDNKKARSI